MAKATDQLTDLYSRFLQKQSAEWRAQTAKVDKERQRTLDRLKKRRVGTVADLRARFFRLSGDLKLSTIDLIWLLGIRQAVPLLFDSLADPALRLASANILGWFERDGKVTRYFIEVGRRELASNTPDRAWLEAVILGLAHSRNLQAVDLLVTIYERTDLPSSVRGDAADKLGCESSIKDRRTKLFRRCRDTALRGISDDSIEVQFWSMYLIGSMCCVYDARRHAIRADFKSTLPLLRRIAKHDQRLSPGYWWPMSAEAEDVIGCIETGTWPQPDAADRWLGKTERGKYCG